MKTKLILLVCILLTLTLALFTLTSCGCDHIDKNDDGKCDECGDEFTDGKDIPDPCAHRDADDNSLCDKCGAAYTDDKDITHTCTPGSAMRENEIAATCKSEGSFEIVTYCSVCSQELSRISQTTEKTLIHDYANGICAYCDAEALYSEGLTFVTNNDSTCYISGIGTCSDTALMIPHVSPNGDTVTAIGDSAFYNCENLTSIEIPDTVISIGEYAFFGCEALERVTIGRGIRSFGSAAFDFPSFSPYTTPRISSLYIKDLAAWCSIDFRDPYSLTRHTNPLNRSDGLYVIENGRATLITDLVIPDTVIYIGCGAFESYTALKSVTISDSVTTIASNAFSYCSNLTSVHIGARLNEFYPPMFLNNENLALFTVSRENTSFQAIDGNLYSKDGSAFFLYTPGKNDTEFEIPQGVVDIYDSAFGRNAHLTTITIPDSVTSIGWNAFAGCTALTSIILPKSVSDAEFAFHGCNQDACIYFMGTQNDWQLSLDQSSNPKIRYYSTSGICIPELPQWKYDSEKNIVHIDCKDTDGDHVCNHCNEALACTDASYVYVLPRALSKERFDTLYLKPFIQKIQQEWTNNVLDDSMEATYNGMYYIFGTNENAVHEDGIYDHLCVVKYIGSAMGHFKDAETRETAINMYQILTEYALVDGAYILNPNLSNVVLSDLNKRFLSLIAGYTCKQRVTDEHEVGFYTCESCYFAGIKACTDSDHDDVCDICKNAITIK